MAHIEDRWEKVVDNQRSRTDRHGRGRRWRARYLDPDGRERARTFARKLDAERFLAGIESDKSRGLYVDPAAGRLTVGSTRGPGRPPRCTGGRRPPRSTRTCATTSCRRWGTARWPR